MTTTTKKGKSFLMKPGSVSIIIIVLILAVPVLQCSPEQKIDSPNILFIAVDDLKPIMNCYGNPQIVTPNMDKLASQGALFRNNHCQQAVCGPSRASLLTGLRPDHTGVWDLKTRMRDVHPNILALPQYFRQMGYTTAALGKIFDPRCVGPKYDSSSWSIPYISDPDLERADGIKDPMFGHYQGQQTREKGQILLNEAETMGLEGYERVKYGLKTLKPVVESADVADNAYYDGIMTEHAIERLNQLASNSDPFFLAVGFKKPHLPFVAPEKYWDLYKRSEIDLNPYQEMSKNGPEIAYHNSGELRSYTGYDWVNERIPGEQQKEIIHGYYAAVSYVDALIGNIVNKLEELGLKENTIIVLWGDHGWHLGDHGMWCKHSNFEQATRSPLIISAPGMPDGIIIDSPTEFIDVFPSLCDLAHIEIPDGLDGTSLLPLINGNEKSIKKYAVSQFHRGKKILGYSIRSERYRYTEWHNNYYISTHDYDPANIIGRELYDYEKDPLEKINFVDDKAYKEIEKELSTNMKEFLTSQVQTANEQL